MSRTVPVVGDYARFRAGARMLLDVDGYEVIGDAADAPAVVLTSSRDWSDSVDLIPCVTELFA